MKIVLEIIFIICFFPDNLFVCCFKLNSVMKLKWLVRVIFFERIREYYFKDMLTLFWRFHVRSQIKLEFLVTLAIFLPCRNLISGFIS